MMTYKILGYLDEYEIGFNADLDSSPWPSSVTFNLSFRGELLFQCSAFGTLILLWQRTSEHFGSSRSFTTKEIARNFSRFSCYIASDGSFYFNNELSVKLGYCAKIESFKTFKELSDYCFSSSALGNECENS